MSALLALLLVAVAARQDSAPALREAASARPDGAAARQDGVVARQGAAAARGESIEPWFPRLESESWIEREEAQRRLAAALEPKDAAQLRAALLAGGAETRLRLAHVLGDEDRLFGTAAQLAIDPDATVARAGLTGLRLAIERFEPRAFDAPIPREDLWSALAEHDGVAIDARATPAFEPSELADLLALAQPSAPRIVLDTFAAADADPGPASARRAVTGGAWRELARGTAKLADGRIVGFGVRRDTSPYSVRWIAIVGRDVDDDEIGAAALVERWCLDLARDGDPTARAAAARALGAHGMPVAIEWMSRAFRESRDEAALEGLLLAARRGGVPAVLQEPFARDVLWSAVEDTARRDDARAPEAALHAALALAAVGAPTGENASAELARALRDLDPADPRRAYGALVVLEGWAGPHSAPAIGSAIRGLAARTDLSNALRLEVLRVAERLAITDLPLADPAQAFLAALATGHGLELTRLLRGTPGWPPAAWAEDVTDPTLAVVLRDGSVRVMLVDAWLARGELEPAAKVLGRLAASAPRATEGLRSLALPPAPLREALTRAARAADASEFETATWMILCGVATPTERAAFNVELAARAPASEAEWFALAESCAGATGESAREHFVAVMSEGEPDVVLIAAGRAVRALREDLDDVSERAFLQAVRGAVRAVRGGPLDRAFGSEAWPPSIAGPPRLLRDLDRDPARGPR